MTEPGANSNAVKTGAANNAVTQDIPLSSVVPEAPAGPAAATTARPGVAPAAQKAAGHESMSRSRSRAAGMAAADDPVAALKTELQMTGAPDQRRALELLAMLAACAVNLDRAVWEVWGTLAPEEARPAASLQQMMGRFLEASHNVSHRDVEAGLEELQRLTVAVATAVNQAGHQFAQAHLRTFAPETIKAATLNSGGALETRAWKKYTELFGHLSAEGINAQIAESIRDYVIEYLRR